MTLTERQFEAPEVTLNYAAGGQGQPILLLHGGGGRWQGGETFLDLLIADGWRVYAPDLRGHGHSGRVPGAYNLADHVPDIAAFLERVVAESTIVFGHSLGGEIAVMLASQRPELFRALIVGDAPLSTTRHITDDRGPRAMNVFLHDLAGKHPSEIAPALRDMPLGPDQKPARAILGEDHPWYDNHALTMSLLDRDMLAAVLAGSEVMLAGYDPRALLPRISCPVLLLQADPDGPMQGGMLRDDDLALGLALLPNVRHIRLEGIGHPLHSPSDQAPRVLEAIRPFLRSV